MKALSLGLMRYSLLILLCIIPASTSLLVSPRLASVPRLSTRRELLVQSPFPVSNTIRTQKLASKVNDSNMDNTSNNGSSLRRVLFKLNSSTKWIVLVAHSVAVWTRRDFIAPFIVVGSICSVALAEILKKTINQARPNGAALLDPGMPSSHALVSCFSAAAWSLYLLSGAGSTLASGVSAAAGSGSAVHALSQASRTTVAALLLTGAGIISALRVACGYHTLAQVTVGAGVGVVTAVGWHALGATILQTVDLQTATALTWAAYLVFSGVFIRQRILRKWVRGREEHHA